MHKHFQTHFLGTNVSHLPEWYLMDTFIADCPVLDDGIASLWD